MHPHYSINNNYLYIYYLLNNVFNQKYFCFNPFSPVDSGWSYYVTFTDTHWIALSLYRSNPVTEVFTKSKKKDIGIRKKEP